MSSHRRIHAVVPIKDPAFGKTRLAPVLDARERRALCQFLARQTVDACIAAFGGAMTIVVTTAPDIARYAGQAGVQFVPEETGADDLNAAVTLGVVRAVSDRSDGVLVVAADLALLTVADLRAAAEAIPPAPGCLIVPDRHESGTNLLGMTPPDPKLLSFGELSMRRHADLAAAAGYQVRFHRSAALALDLDLPDDYAAWRRGCASRQEEAHPTL